jgi:hypothetical protein
MKKRFGLTLKGAVHPIKHILTNIATQYDGDAFFTKSNGAFYFYTREQREAFAQDIDPEWKFTFIFSVITGG